MCMVLVSLSARPHVRSLGVAAAVAVVHVVELTEDKEMRSKKDRQQTF